jgi:AcrR family transcriptional regulator
LFRRSGATAPFLCIVRGVSPQTVTKSLRSDARRNRERLVASARELFATAGVEVSVEEITAHAGLGMGTLYRHFPSKDELIDAVLEDAFAEIVRLAKSAAAEEDAWVGLTGFLEQVLALHAQNYGLKDVLAARSPGRQREAMRAHVRRLVRGLVERAQKQGTLRTDFSPEDLPLVFWSTGRVIETTAHVAPDYWRRHLAFLLDGLRASSATPLTTPPLTRSELARAQKGRSG